MAFDKDFQAFASPMPHPRAKYMGMVEPFQPLVWLCILLATIGMSFVLLFLGRTESDILLLVQLKKVLKRLSYTGVFSV